MTRSEMLKLAADAAEWRDAADWKDNCGRLGRLLEQLPALFEEHTAEIKRLHAQARCGHNPWPCACDFQGKGFNPRAEK